MLSGFCNVIASKMWLCHCWCVDLSAFSKHCGLVTTKDEQMMNSLTMENSIFVLFGGCRCLKALKKTSCTKATDCKRFAPDKNIKRKISFILTVSIILDRKWFENRFQFDCLNQINYTIHGGRLIIEIPLPMCILNVFEWV